jgi:hypothetical protein
MIVWLMLSACDDEIFPAVSHGAAVSGDTYADVVTVLDGACVTCHAGATPAGGLDLATDPCAALVAVDSSTYSAPLVSPGDHAGSVLWLKMSDADRAAWGGVMPPAGGLASTSVDTVAAWIDAGAACDADTATPGAEP